MSHGADGAAAKRTRVASVPLSSERLGLLGLCGFLTAALGVNLPGPYHDPSGWAAAAGSAAVVGLSPLALLVVLRWRPPQPDFAPVAVALRARSPVNLTCACCKSRDDGRLETCFGCGVAMHGECWDLLHRCPTLGCRRSAAGNRAQEPGGKRPLPQPPGRDRLWT